MASLASFAPQYHFVGVGRLALGLACLAAGVVMAAGACLIVNISWTSSEMKERRSVNSLNGEYGVAVRCLRCSDGSNHPRGWDEPAQPVLWAELSQLVGFSRRIREQFSSLAGVSPAPAPCPLPHSSRTPLACSIRRRSQCAGARLLHGRSASSSVRAQTHTLLAGFFLLAHPPQPSSPLSSSLPCFVSFIRPGLGWVD